MTSVLEASEYSSPTAGPSAFRHTGGKGRVEDDGTQGHSPGSDTKKDDVDAMDVSDGPTDVMGPPPIVDQNNMHNATKITNARAPTTMNSANGGAVANGIGGSNNSNNSAGPGSNSNGGGTAAAAASTQQPKVVQTAFIHKLYNMLEDQNIQHLISWSGTGDSFLISPTAEFSRVLSSYFKHTQISSFVRQLNMYGFHKVSDVFHSASPETALWEFKHGNGNFKKGDLVGLKEIKRRASRQTLTHRDSFAPPAAPKPPPMPPVASVAAEPPSDPLEARFGMLEQSLYEAHNRLARAEEHMTFLLSKCQMLTDSAMKCFHSTHDLTNLVTTMAPDPGSQVHRDALAVQAEITRQMESVRAFDSLHQHPHPQHRPSFASHTPADNAVPVSPFQLAQDDQLRGSRPPAMHSVFRDPWRSSVSSQYPISPDRRGSFGLRPGSPSSRTPINNTLPRPALPPGLPNQLEKRAFASTAFTSPNIARRHTSGDIAQDWLQQHPLGGAPSHSGEQLAPTQQNIKSPYESGRSSTHHPSSPRQPPPAQSNAQIRESLAQYSLAGRSASTSGPSMPNHVSTPSLWHTTHQQISPSSTANTHEPQSSSLGPPPLFHGFNRGTAPSNADGQWSSPRAVSSGVRDNNLSTASHFALNNPASLPPSRRSSVAHLLNPSESASGSAAVDHGYEEARDRDQGSGEEDRKRKRLA